MMFSFDVRRHDGVTGSHKLRRKVASLSCARWYVRWQLLGGHWHTAFERWTWVQGKARMVCIRMLGGEFVRQAAGWDEGTARLWLSTNHRLTIRYIQQVAAAGPHAHVSHTHVAQDAAPGALDGSLELLLPLMEGDLFGDVADAKEAAAFAANYRGRPGSPVSALPRA